MAVSPIRSLATGPLLALWWSKLRRTPTARLAITYRLGARTACGTWSTGGAAVLPHPSRRDNRLEFCREGNVAERPVAETLRVERLAGGGIVGTWLPVLDCAVGMPTDAVAGDRAGQQVDLIS